MGRNNRKTERRRLKRQHKRRNLQRGRQVSPYRRIGTSGEVEACYLNRHWRDEGMASIHCLRRVPGGGFAMAAFLVDLWCAGLKDAWGLLEITADRFREKVLENSAEIEIVRVDIGLARRLVAGGIRFASQNGFRLPRRYRRWTAFLGDIGPVESADLSDFGVDGGLRYVGTMEDLRRRLIGCTAEQFMHRDDVHYVMDASDFTLLDDDEMVVEEAFDALHEKGLSAIREWCFANGVPPHPRLPEAIDITFEAMGKSGAGGVDDEGSDAEVETAADNIDLLLSVERPEDQASLRGALSQIQAFMREFDDPAALFESLGLDAESEGQ